MIEDKQKKEQELLEQIRDSLENVETRCRDNLLEIPEWDVSLRMELAGLEDRSAVLVYFLNSPKWDRELFECSAGLGQDQESAIGMAQGSFLFGMLDGVRAMSEGERIGEIQSEFAGSTHKWDVYQSNLVGMGEMPEETDAQVLWKLLREEVIKRLGNQRLCYIKVYCAKNGEDITGECRINDVAVPARGLLVEDFARGWKTKSFGSQKQFFFLCQQEETYTPYPHTQEEVACAVQTALRLYQQCLSQADDRRYLSLLEEELKDSSLVEELHAFLPELCAENAFPAVHCGETVGIACRGTQTTVYKSQLASYYWISWALGEALQGDFPNGLFSALVSASAMYHAVSQAKEKGADLAGEGGSLSVCFSFSDRYVLR